ncbi:hypothetical protein BPOR_1194g00010 [Botrytis porri]|uniref:Uncharacterized protein n=1 Tax=Botrytis porri TaxID=87229 RepID=A0A4Z1KIP6_9HELO|nr:hypothetical protein BPOR_1194g00010 [Botrytis porri]
MKPWDVKCEGELIRDWNQSEAWDLRANLDGESWKCCYLPDDKTPTRNDSCKVTGEHSAWSIVHGMGEERRVRLIAVEHQLFLDSLEDHSNIKVERGIFPYTLSFDETKAEDSNEHPIEVVLQHLTDDQMNPRQSQAARDGAASSDGLFRSNIAADMISMKF